MMMFHHDNEGRDICLSTAGTYFVVGYTTTNLHPQVVKINDRGDSLWSQFYPTINFWPTRCVSDGNGNCIMVGERGGNGRVKLDGDGNIVWNIPNDTFPSEFYGLIKTQDNGYVACGSAGTPIIGYVMRFDSLGGLIWGKSYSTSGQMRFYSITDAFNGGYLVGGTEAGKSRNKGIIIRIDKNGNEIWRKYPLNNTYDRSCNMIRKFQNKYVILGGDGDSAYVAKIDTSGNVIFNKLNLAARGGVYFSSIEIRGEVYNTNEVILYRNLSGQKSDFTTIEKLDSNFNQLTFLRIDYFHGFSHLTGCLPNINGDILFAGFVENEGWFNDNFYVIRTDSNLISPPIGITPISNEIPRILKFYQNYPNPFNPSTKIKFDIPKNGIAKMILYNVTGQVISEIFDKELKAGVYEVSLDMADKPSGVYFVKLEAGSFVQTKKMVLVK